MFSGWSGACSGTGDCVLNMVGDRSVTASFDLDTLHSTFIPNGSGKYGPTIQGAYDGSSDSDVIKIWGIDFTENLWFNKEKKVTIRGGFNDAYDTQDRATILHGTLKITGGSVKVERLTFR